MDARPKLQKLIADAGAAAAGDGGDGDAESLGEFYFVPAIASHLQKFGDGTAGTVKWHY